MMNLRWRIATLLDRSRRTCWTSLVIWALRWEGETVRSTFGGRGCERSKVDGSCYCGKFRDETNERKPVK